MQLKKKNEDRYIDTPSPTHKNHLIPERRKSNLIFALVFSLNFSNAISFPVVIIDDRAAKFTQRRPNALRFKHENSLLQETERRTIFYYGNTRETGSSPACLLQKTTLPILASHSRSLLSPPRALSFVSLASFRRARRKLFSAPALDSAGDFSLSRKLVLPRSLDGARLSFYLSPRARRRWLSRSEFYFPKNNPHAN